VVLQLRERAARQDLRPGLPQEGAPRALAAGALLVPLGAAYTWITGILLLFLVYWFGGTMVDPDKKMGRTRRAASASC